MNSGVYKIVNILDDKVYVGSGQYIEIRWSDHKSQLRKNIHHSIHLQRAWNKYGEDQFKFEIIELTEPIKSKLIEREQYWIDYYRSANMQFGYNINPKADSRLGSVSSKETREKISKSMLGKKHKFAKRNRLTLSQEHRDKISLAQKGKSRSPRSQEVRNKISKGMKNRFVNTCM